MEVSDLSWFFTVVSDGCDNFVPEIPTRAVKVFFPRASVQRLRGLVEISRSKIRFLLLCPRPWFEFDFFLCPRPSELDLFVRDRISSSIFCFSRVQYQSSSSIFSLWSMTEVRVRFFRIPRVRDRIRVRFCAVSPAAQGFGTGFDFFWIPSVQDRGSGSMSLEDRSSSIFL